MWRSPAPWTFTLDTGSVFLGQTLGAFRAWFDGRVPHWSDELWGGFPLFGDCTSAALYPLHVIPYLATGNAPLRFFDVTGNEAAETTFLGHRPPPLLGARNANLDHDE